MTDAPFIFSDAKPAKDIPAKEAKHGVKSVPKQTTQTKPTTGAASPTPDTPAARRRGRPSLNREELPPIKVELMGAIRAAAILDETDANAFEAVVKILNGRDARSRERIARALSAVFA